MSEDLNQIYCGRSLDMNTNPYGLLNLDQKNEFDWDYC